jgi:23S rRNA (guanosine2251-2'-O)-methyltransferase
MKPPHSGRHGGPRRPDPDRDTDRPQGSGHRFGHGAERRSAEGPRPPRPDQRGGSEARGDRAQQGGGFAKPDRDRRELPRDKPEHAEQERRFEGRQGSNEFRPGHHPHRSNPRHGQDHRPRHDHANPLQRETPRGAVWLYGQHAIAAALANPARRLRRLLLTEEAEATLAARLAPPWALPPERTERGRLDHLLGRDTAHQGAALLADPLPTPSLAQALERPGPILVLDQVTDPRNVGAILRSAAAFGAASVVTQDRNTPEETGALAKAASGALESVPLLRAVNIARTLIALRAAGLWIVGLDAGAPAPLSGPALAGRRVALVLGAEGTGLRRLTRETCDEVAGLAMPGSMESLNVSAAAAVALYELARRA